MSIATIEAFLTAAQKQPLEPVKAQAAYGAFGVDELLILCRRRYPNFAISLHVYPTGQVMMNWSYNYVGSPMWEWQRTRPQEVHQGGVYNSIRECLVTVLGRADRFGYWTWEQKKAQEKHEAKLRAQRAAAAAPTEKPPEVDEGDEPAVPVEPLPEVTPLPEDPLASVGAPAGTPLSTSAS